MPEPVLHDILALNLFVHQMRGLSLKLSYISNLLAVGKVQEGVRLQLVLYGLGRLASEAPALVLGVPNFLVNLDVSQGSSAQVSHLLGFGLYYFGFTDRLLQK